MSNAPTRLIAIDWGTTSARAYRLGDGGQVVAQRAAPFGVQQVRNGAFAEALRALLGDWHDLPVPRLACGMVGSRQGWIEAPYRQCPAPVDDLARGLTITPGGELAIVAGITCRDAAGVPDVMRGEETQIVGLLDSAPAEALVIQPGTHSKWTRAGVPVAGAPAIHAFTSFMTGEVFALLREHSILGRLMGDADGFDGASFDRGLAHGGRGVAGGDLLHQIFGARTLALFDELAPAAVADYLSGVLIGAEIVAGRAWVAAQAASPPGPGAIWIAGAPDLCNRYARALDHAGVETQVAPADVAARGLWRLAEGAGLTHPGDRS
ncbi:MAG: 2-dehydro-3-deoxygalactonokinase [Casimicrobiaceae bacterium]